MNKGILLSPAHGVNPALGVCPVCYGENGEIVLCGKLKGDAEAPRHIVTDHLCDECRGRQEQGFIAMIVVESFDRRERTGEIVWMKRETFERCEPSVEVRRAVLEKGLCFIDREFFGALQRMQAEAEGG